MDRSDLFRTIAIVTTLLVIIAFCIIFLDKFNAPPESEIQTFQSEYVYDYVDPKTGVHYLLYAIGGKGGICVRYNADGTLMVDDLD